MADEEKIHGTGKFLIFALNILNAAILFGSALSEPSSGGGSDWWSWLIPSLILSASFAFYLKKSSHLSLWSVGKYVLYTYALPALLFAVLLAGSL